MCMRICLFVNDELLDKIVINNNRNVSEFRDRFQETQNKTENN